MSEHPLILVVDDDPGQRSLLDSFLSKLGFHIIMAASGEEALNVLGSQSVDMMITDVRMPGISGLEILRRAREEDPSLPVLLVTAYADIRDAVDAMRDGALNYLEKPIDLDELESLIRQSLGIIREQPGAQNELPSLPKEIIAQSPRMRDVFREVAMVAPSDSRILITGESGTGKEVVADRIHAWSHRRSGPMIKINCAAIPETLLESELFGHEKGAFTGAVQRRRGRFEDADGGTIFLDEISEMSPGLQAKLLRVIQDGVFQRVGANEELRTNARILAATNRDLEKEVSEGRFREDLFYRLNVFEIYIPPLRQRVADIMPLANMFAAHFSGGRPRFSASTAAGLALYSWPGNVRELQNAMERATLMAGGKIILPEHLPKRIRKAALKTADSGMDLKGKRMEEIEQIVILQTLKEKKYNRTETARALGISRRALIYKLRRFAEEGLSVNPE